MPCSQGCATSVTWRVGTSPSSGGCRAEEPNGFPTSPPSWCVSTSTSSLPSIIPRSSQRRKRPGRFRSSWFSPTDPVGTRFVASLAWPGGNITGLTTQSIELQVKALQLLKEALPNASRMAVLWIIASQSAEHWREKPRWPLVRWACRLSSWGWEAPPSSTARLLRLLPRLTQEARAAFRG